MIFCTIGTQAPFDRFIKIIDELAPSLNEEVIAQTLNGTYCVKNIKTIGLLPPNEFSELFNKARIIVAHAGVGTILSALVANKPLVIFPRQAKLGEHRNDHQLATAEQMNKLGYVYVANDEDSLKKLLFQENLLPLKKLGNFASKNLIDELHSVIG